MLGDDNVDPFSWFISSLNDTNNFLQDGIRSQWAKQCLVGYANGLNDPFSSLIPHFWTA